MSLMVFLIALIPAVGVIVVANTTRNKGAVVIAALIATAVGAAAGNPAYTGLDLVFVGIATYVSWQIAKTPIHRTPEEVAAAQEKARVERIKAEEAKAAAAAEAAEELAKKEDTREQIKYLVDHGKVVDATLKAMASENTLQCYCLLACLRGLAEQGCNGPVHDGIDKLEKYLNQKAHGEV